MTETNEDLGRRMPSDPGAEQSVLGGLLIAARYIDDVAAVIRPADFYEIGHQAVAAAIYDLNARGEAVDVVTVHDELAKRDQLGRVGGGGYLHTLTMAVPTAANVTYYARIVRNKAQLRRLVEVGTRVAGYGYTGDGEEVDALIAQAHQDLITQQVDEDDLTTLDTLMADTLDGLESDDRADRVPLPYVDLQALLGGLKAGQMVIVGARPSVGKSVVALDIARHAALKHRLPVFFASLEMDKRELGRRLLASEGTIMLDRLESRSTLTDEDWAKVATTSARIAANPHLVIDDTPNITVERLRAKLRKMARSATGPARLLVVDYLQLMRPLNTAGRKSPENRQVEVAEMSRDLKLLAKEFAIPVVVVAQLNRGVEQRAEKKPVISDLRESGALEQDADVVILLSRETDQDSLTSVELDLIVGKNRAGRTGAVSVIFQGHYTRAADMYREDKPVPRPAPHLRALPPT